jgi:hypothetical protein
MLLDCYKPTLARGFNGSSQYLSLAGAVLTAEPLTMAAWAWTSNTTAANVIMSISNNGSFGQYQLNASGDSGGDPLIAQKQDDVSASGTASTAVSYPVSTWFHAAAVYVSDTSRFVYLNGKNKAANTTNVSDPTADFTSVGVLRRSSLAGYFNGQIAWPAIWNVALSDADLEALAKGAHPTAIHPESLVAFWDWTGADYEPGIKSAYPLTNSGSVPVNGPAFLKTRIPRPWMLGSGYVAGGGFNAAWASQRTRIIGGGVA